MAKKGTTVRVHQLAKELGVPSKEIVAKCKAEDIPGISNHMSTVSLGLQATIREWFGDVAESQDSSTATAVQTAAPVDVKKARAKAKKKTVKRASDDDDKDTSTATETKRAKKPKAEDTTSTRTRSKTTTKAKPATEQSLPETSDDDQATSDGKQSKAAPDTTKTDSDADQEQIRPAAQSDEGGLKRDASGTPVMNVPSRPDVVTPAGPQLQQPTKTKLSGPRVIRVETPDIIPSPKAKGGQRTGGGTRSGRGAGGGIPETDDQTAGAGRGGRSASRRNKRRSASAGEAGGRTGRTSTPSSGGGAGRPFNWREQDLLERERRLNRAGGFFKQARRDNLKRTTGGGHRAQTAAQSGGAVKIEEPITIKELSAATGIKSADILRKLLLSGKPVNVNSIIDSETAIEVVLDYDIELEVVEQKSAEAQIEEQFEVRELVDERPRSPVVTILGHVDHGKTSLLDRIRNANVAEGEAGGITQATSAFRVPVKLGDESRQVTFIDTPGHEAFTEMRARGAKVTDIVVLVVAADDGVMPQTVESINHARAADVPIVVALNKTDKPEATDANIQRILGQLAEHELNPTEWGGSTEVVRTSAIQGEGIQDILEVLDYQAQLLELKADFGGPAVGTVIEAEMQEGRGAVAKVLVQHGKLQRGDFIAVGRAYGRVRDLVDDRARRIEEAGPATPVAISGLNTLPDAGDKFYVVKTMKEAEAAAEERIQQERQRELTTDKITLDNIFQKLADSKKKELPLVIKADVQGSLETLRATLEKIANEEIAVSIKHSGVGGVSESDVSLAEASGAIVIGFNVTTSAAARRAAEARGVDVRFYDVIYDVIDDVKKAAEGLLDPELKLEVLGHAEVRDVFKVSKVGMVAGCYVTDGVVERNAQIRVTRDGIVIEKDRRLEQLKRFKDDAKEVRAGHECGMRIVGYDDIRVGDVLECYKTLEVRRSLDS